jgi:hypothetical protein
LDSCIGLGLGDGKLALEAMKKKHDEKVKRNATKAATKKKHAN